MIAIFYQINALVILCYFGLIILGTAYSCRKKLVLKKRPNISIMLPVFNGEDNIEECIDRIYNSYDQNKIDLIVVNDCSKDRTLEILKRLKREYGFNLLDNKENLGKTASLNKAFHFTKEDIVLTIDVDTGLNKKAIEELLARFQDERVALVTCFPSPKQDSTIARLQNVDFGFVSSIAHTLSISSATMGLLGSCMAVRRKQFIQVGLYTFSAMTEDSDLTYKINELGYKAQICKTPVSNMVHEKIKPIFKQKVRWSAGSTMDALNHFRTFLLHPINFIFIVLYILMGVLGLIVNISNYQEFGAIYSFMLANYAHTGIINSILQANAQNSFVLYWLLAFILIYPLFFIPSLILNKPKLGKSLKGIQTVYLYGLIYLPLIFIPIMVGVIKGIYKFLTLNERKRGW